MSKSDLRKTDVLIMGGGGAGCRAAIESASFKCQVLLASKYPIGKSGATVVAENFYAAPFRKAEPHDSTECYLQDMIRGGRQLCDLNLAQTLANEGWDRVKDLERYGVPFRKGEAGNLAQVGAPGHSYARGMSLEAGGLGIIRGLQRELKKYPQVQLFEDVIFTKILTNSGAVAGAMAVDIRKGKPIVIQSKAIIIATGGYSTLWSHNDVPCDCTGDGIVMAYHAGTDLVDLEMALFYPTVVIHPPSLHGVLVPHGLLIEQVQAKLLNGRLEEFAPKKIPTRDVMNSLIYREIANGNGTPHGGVFLDVSQSPLSRDELKKRLMIYLPQKYRYLLKNGIDITREPLEVAPMAHYTLGGVRIGSNCQTSVRGLYCAGEVEGNVHGANRIGGNALPETQVFGAKAGEMAAQWAIEHDHMDCDMQEVERELNRMESLFQSKKDPINPSQLKAKLQNIMWSHVGPEREEQGLKKAIKDIAKMKERDLPRAAIPPVREFNLLLVEALEVSHMLDLSEMVARSALRREETRGHHLRTDFPETNDKIWLKHTLIRKEGGKMKLWADPVVTMSQVNPKSASK